MKNRSPQGRREGALTSSDAPTYYPTHPLGPSVERPRMVQTRPTRRAWYARPKGPCATNCGRKARTRHHVVYRQAVERAGGAIWDLRNGLPLCPTCHAAHHQPGIRRRVIALAALTDEAFEFARELLGAGRAYNYLSRHYAGADPRLTALLRQA